MLTKTDVQKIIDECRETGARGLGSGIKATIEDLTVDFLIPPTDFLGAGTNPAIFVNHDTYSLLGKYHPTWVANKTIAVKESFLEKNLTMVIGIIIHEAGHAFNVAAHLINSEANAYIFEIEVISTWFKTKNPFLFNCTRVDFQLFFESRLPYYHAETKHCEYLAELVNQIELNRILGPLDAMLSPAKIRKSSSSAKFVVPIPTLLDPKTIGFFGSREPRTAGCCAPELARRAESS